MFLAKDFIETAENLIFAVVADGTEQGKVLCFLRYVQQKKVATHAANQLLIQHHADYLHYSPVLDAQLHAVPVERIIKHHQPKQRLQAIQQIEQPDAVDRDFIALCQLLQVNGLDLSHCGVTGSLLIGVQQASSDIDLVCYNADVFQHCRAIVRELIARDVLQELSNEDWQQSYQRRDCELSFADYVWHERRKFNKAVINGRKFDLNLINPSSAPASRYQKCGAITVQCRVLDDTEAFAYPAELIIDHPQIHSAVSFTATYTGQAVNGELIEIAGVVEQDAHGVKRIVVGSSREAHCEYIKVIRCLT
ncbi:MAG: hypothetical protein EXR80_09780 [Methylococcales bacterium]|nr:hypothetical protein [Methylococcales bacterium]